MVTFYVFLACAIIGSIILIAGVLSDGLLDLDGGGVSAFGVFLAAFGAIGLISSRTTSSPYWYIGISAGLAIVLTILFVLLMRLLRKQGEGEVNEIPSWDEAVGKQVSVIHWKGDRGEILVTHAGTTHRLPAKSVTVLESPNMVVITQILSDQSAVVAPIDGSISQ